MWSTRKLRKPVARSHHVASVQVSPQYTQPSGRTVRTLTVSLFQRASCQRMKGPGAAGSAACPWCRQGRDVGPVAHLGAPRFELLPHGDGQGRIDALRPRRPERRVGRRHGEHAPEGLAFVADAHCTFALEARERHATP